jgi:hypothetical protein
MCFSAPASFIASGALLTLGGATWAVARKKDKILIAIPVLFGIQQFFEGMQWLSLGRGEPSLWAGYGFLFFALIVWPAYVPFFVHRLDAKRRKALRVFVAAGAAVSLYCAVRLMMEPLLIFEKRNCVNYSFNLHEAEKWGTVLAYLFAVLGALLVSSRAIFKWFGLAISVLFVIAYALYERAFLSVWCFFAAAVSSLFFLYVQRRRVRRDSVS